jgi:hypothetical protein
MFMAGDIKVLDWFCGTLNNSLCVIKRVFKQNVNFKE